jgi:2-polyprenyl-3-methyl-5-hydroxy-6-metoxy-1,4-benzoquinol methylase
MKKYYNIEGPYGPHTQVSAWVGKSKKVLDVGCGSGHLCRILKENNCEITGLDISPKSAKLVEAYCNNVLIGNIETMELSLAIGYFDVILFVDVLEHLKDPLATLNRLKRYLSNNGIYIASIPNVANWQVRMNLLFGRWEYKEDGLLDRTHLRFFTFKSAKELINGAGLQIIKLDVTPSFPTPLLYNFHTVQYLRYLIAKIWRGMFALQFLIVAKRVGT